MDSTDISVKSREPLACKITLRFKNKSREFKSPPKAGNVFVYAASYILKAGEMWEEVETMLGKHTSSVSILHYRRENLRRLEIAIRRSKEIGPNPILNPSGSPFVSYKFCLKARHVHMKYKSRKSTKESKEPFT